MTTTWMGTKLTSDVRRTVDRECANCHNTKCLLLDSTCFYHRPLDEGQQPQRCAYFESSVIDAEPSVKQEYEQRLNRYLGIDDTKPDETTVNCQDCSKPYVRRSNRQTRCPACQATARRQSLTDAKRRYRNKEKQA